MAYGRLVYERRRNCRGRRLVVASLAMTTFGYIAGCAGPQPLDVAMNPLDQDAYVAELNLVNGDARTAFANWMAKTRGASANEVLAQDASLSTTRNPFDAYHDASAVSRGAVTYNIHCARCHGISADGDGPSVLPEYPATSFKTFGKRLTSTLHRGAPKKWFRVIRDGSGDPVDYPEEHTTAMPPFGDKLTREQTWLAITYLQSLDVHADGQRGSHGDQ